MTRSLFTSSRFRSGVWLGFTLAAAILCLYFPAGCHQAARNPAPHITIDDKTTTDNGARNTFRATGGTVSGARAYPSTTLSLFGGGPEAPPTMNVDAPGPGGLIWSETLQAWAFAPGNIQAAHIEAFNDEGQKVLSADGVSIDNASGTIAAGTYAEKFAPSWAAATEAQRQAYIAAVNAAADVAKELGNAAAEVFLRALVPVP